jgi:hypothetical protein
MSPSEWNPIDTSPSPYILSKTFAGKLPESKSRLSKRPSLPPILTSQTDTFIRRKSSN